MSFTRFRRGRNFVFVNIFIFYFAIFRSSESVDHIYNLVWPKDKIPKENLCGLIYHIQCRDCHNNYIRETGRNLGTRVKEHTARKGHDSAAKEHKDKYGQSSTSDQVKVQDRKDHWYQKIKEAI